MTGGGKPGKPKSGFPPFPPPLEIALRFPHSHSFNDSLYIKGEAKAALLRNQQLRVGQIKPPEWAKWTCQTHLNASPYGRRRASLRPAAERGFTRGWGQMRRSKGAKSS